RVRRRRYTAGAAVLARGAHPGVPAGTRHGGRVRRRWASAALLLCGAVLAQSPPPEEPAAAPAPPLPPPAVLSHLARGVSLSQWFQNVELVEPKRYALDEVDWLRIRALRLRNVRVVIDPAFLLGPRGQPRPAAISDLRTMIADATAQDLLVV